jgi:hypothetical protein
MSDENIPDFLRKGAPARILPGFGFGCSFAPIDPSVMREAFANKPRTLDVVTEIVDGQPRGFRINEANLGTMRGVSVGYIDGEKVVTSWVREQQRYKPTPAAIALALMAYDETVGENSSTGNRFDAMRAALIAAHGKD